MGITRSALEGGNFWQGAVTGLVVSGLNHLMHDNSQDYLEQNNDDDPPISFKQFIKDLFTWKTTNESDYSRVQDTRSLFYEATDKGIAVGSFYLDAMTTVITLPFPSTGKIRATGWISRSVYKSLDPAIRTKFVAAIGKGVVSPTGKQGIIKLSQSEVNALGGKYTYKLKILGKGGDIRIYGNQLDNGHFVFNFLTGH